MPHKKFISSLSSQQRRSLTKRSDLPGIIRLICHWCLIGVMGTAIYWSVPGWPLLLIPQGILIVFLFSLVHESIHQTAFKSSWLNNICALVCGFFIFLPCTWFKYFHFAHHRFTQIPGKDPELATQKPNNKLSYLVYISGLPTWFGHFKTLMANAVGFVDLNFVPEAKRPIVTRESQLLLVSYTAILSLILYTSSFSLLWTWIIPLLAGQPFLRSYLLAEHTLCSKTNNMFENTRTIFTNAIVRFIGWNMSYHTEHHTYPSVPFHQLPHLHSIMQGKLIHKQTGYMSFNLNYMSKISKKADP